jgi:hypothetical protein
MRFRWGRVGLAFLLATASCGKSDRSPAGEGGGAGVATSLPTRPEGPASAGSPATAVPAGATSRWYEERKDGRKIGWTHVVWEKTTHDGKPAVRDTTRSVERTGRAMMSVVDVFRNESVTVCVRGLDGTLWSLESRVVEPTSKGPRTRTETTTWTGAGYDVVLRLNDAPEERRTVPAAAPAHVDTEAFLSARVASGEAKEGWTGKRRQLDSRDRRVREVDVRVVGREDVEGEAGPVAAWKVVETDPESGAETTLWLDGEGAFVRLKVLAIELRHATEAAARTFDDEVPSYSITVSARPPLERMFAADRVLLEARFPHDPDRPLPDFPDSPWSRTLGTSGNATDGFTVRLELRSYDSQEKTATIPVADPAFARWLEPTMLMECRDPRVVSAAKSAVGGETDARRAAQRIADFVFTLRKQSPEVGQTSAVEILQQRRGDCSEHALLFTALCRAAGIPARQCSGFVCIGEDWGSHAWSEVWTGQWIGVDPTTCDVGTAARYVFYGYPDEPGSRPGLVSERARGRMTLVATRLEEGKEVVDLTDEAAWRTVDEEKRRAEDRLTGVVLEGWPEGWSVSFDEEGTANVSAPGLEAQVFARADQGHRRPERMRREAGPAVEEALYAGRPAVSSQRSGARTVLVSHRRMRFLVQGRVRGEEGAASWKRLEQVLAPTFADR